MTCHILRYCNVCNGSLPSGKKSLACEVCKVRVHKRCAGSAANNCKWTTLPSVPAEAMVAEAETMHTTHQWVRGNLPSNSKCSVCNKQQVHQYPNHYPTGIFTIFTSLEKHPDSGEVPLYCSPANNGVGHYHQCSSRASVAS